MSTHYRFKVGKFECIAVSDGCNKHEARLLFANVPDEELAQVLDQHGLCPDLDVPYICLAVRANGQWVLVDTGSGPREETQVGHLVDNLAAAGIEPAEIKVVILTHGNGDHIGGLTDKDGALTFGQARHVMAKKEWDFWRDNDNLRAMGAKDFIPFVEEKLGAIADRVELLEGETEIVPGVRVIPAEGHTPGHRIVVFSSEGEELWSTADALIHPLLLQRLDWYSVFDLDPQAAMEMRRTILHQVDAGVLVHSFHFPFPGIGRVVRDGAGWRWQPVESSG